MRRLFTLAVLFLIFLCSAQFAMATGGWTDPQVYHGTADVASDSTCLPPETSGRITGTVRITTISAGGAGLGSFAGHGGAYAFSQLTAVDTSVGIRIQNSIGDASIWTYQWDGDLFDWSMVHQNTHASGDNPGVANFGDITNGGGTAGNTAENCGGGGGGGAGTASYAGETGGNAVDANGAAGGSSGGGHGGNYADNAGLTNATAYGGGGGGGCYMSGPEAATTGGDWCVMIEWEVEGGVVPPADTVAASQVIFINEE